MNFVTPTIENYVKQIWRLEENSGHRNVALGALASSMGVTPGTVTSMLKTLSEAGLVVYRPRKGVTLTDQGRSLAMHVLRRHRILELYLVNRLGMDWAEVHEEAEVLEHVVSDKVLRRMEAQLDDTSLDPHGSPIPDEDGVLKDSRILYSLANAASGTEVEIAKVKDQENEFLDFLAKNQLKPGSKVSVLRVDQQAGILVLKHESGNEITLSLRAAAGLEVQ